MSGAYDDRVCRSEPYTFILVSSSWPDATAVWWEQPVGWGWLPLWIVRT